MDAESAEDVRKLSLYDPDTAGGLMELEVFSFHSDETAGTVLKSMIAGDDEFERYCGQHPYIIDESGKLLGVVSLRSLLKSKRATYLADIMSAPISVSRVLTDFERGGKVLVSAIVFSKKALMTNEKRYVLSPTLFKCFF